MIENSLCYWQIREKYQVVSGQLIGGVIGANIENQGLSWPLPHGPQSIISSTSNEAHFTETAIAISIVAESKCRFPLFILMEFYLLIFSSNIIYYFNFKEQVPEIFKNNDPDRQVPYELEKVINVKAIFIFIITVK